MALNNNFLPLFSAIGIEIEYMIVDQKTLDILPIADKVLQNFAGTITDEVELGEIAISNELVKHVIEFKTNGPKKFSYGLFEQFHQAIKQVNDFLETENALLLPTGMHPWFNPEHGVELWPYGDKVIYETYNRIFGCSGHGWSNLQSIHINLPFANNDEFKKLHNAIRIILPLLPSLAASSPFIEGTKSSWLDSRLHFYQQNQAVIPSIAGDIIPEFIQSQKQYAEEILNPMYRAISAHDQDAILQKEWLNSRGAIARFDRMAIEIRVVDTQESPLADITIAYFVQQLLKYLVETTDIYLTQPLTSKQLKTTFSRAIKEGSNTIIADQQLLQQFQLGLTAPISAKEFWYAAAEKLRNNYFDAIEYENFIRLISHGTLAERIVKTLHHSSDRTELYAVYNTLAHCLSDNTFFIP